MSLTPTNLCDHNVTEHGMGSESMVDGHMEVSCISCDALNLLRAYQV